MFGRKVLSFLMIIILLGTMLQVNQAYALESVTLFTPHTGTSAAPGDTIHYNVDVMNNGSSIQSMSFAMEGLPKGWDYNIKSDEADVRELSVKGNSEASITAEISVPLDADKGEYQFALVATDGNSQSTLDLAVSVTEQGSFETELTTKQGNLEGHADSTFSYTVTLSNKTAEAQNYALSNSADDGWGVRFLSEGNSVTSLSLDPNTSTDLTVEVTPPENVEAGTYEIPITASTTDSNSELVLEAVVTGSYGIEVTTPTGVLNTDMTAGDDQTIELVITNTGTAPLTDINLSVDAPSEWEVEFDENTIADLEPGDSKTVKATVTAPKDAIAGDYVATFTASTDETSSDATFRISVGTSTVWGIVSIAIILGVVGGLYSIIRKFGRR
ncbi:NEW3 domain-containing protein [Halalkalibacterium halodurans]|uniref:Alpha-galactosidase NEW3 domain-containing protein n=1 Tax=Halalkalibacterium halodurans TaxID=86665 RepID=A0A0M0KI24_ALKHA|nr:NEW3 domain-containing protein [Halalkalibacterium halodurans]MED3647183.1 NEW3 domain-containing protein [Halalkalibacterium halodurans]TPE69858.1 hypothetical protein AMD02_005550 [Halalkalibacterium halodurans]